MNLASKSNILRRLVGLTRLRTVSPAVVPFKVTSYRSGTHVVHNAYPIIHIPPGLYIAQVVHGAYSPYPGHMARLALWCQMFQPLWMLKVSIKIEHISSTGLALLYCIADGVSVLHFTCNMCLFNSSLEFELHDMLYGWMYLHLILQPRKHDVGFENINNNSFNLLSTVDFKRNYHFQAKSCVAQ